ncbi:zinc-binding alcohol dehydrogenase family protein [Pseudonocardia alni]|uniref:zinc-binding alcohol dehydrogenase family protein n=1 Tax=Pseudonocardia TaxID=1847 RepID=UPI00091C7F39|nr:zinc-binding alcohol dehydrogenase family protein [Pseudonocardia sp. SID8383]MYW75535.1 zinc-binding alcohol dehydrogenase family protein [Pseudonocardia sp. SID8383]OJG05739.1 Zinc-type alcohol dehydrogenase-like protein [Pseudonocardia autotrophica]
MASVPAVVAPRPLSVDDPECLVDAEIEVGAPGPHDLLVDVRAVSVNPVDGKVRSSFDPADGPKVLGFDAAGVVVEVGDRVQGYAPGDEVYYAGAIDRPGSNAHRQLVDSRIVGRKPSTLDFAAAAALPLTSITAWECLYDHLRVTADTTGTLLVVSAAGGVGSMVLQLGRRTGLTLVGTASRTESADWARQMGAHAVADHHDLVGTVREVAPDGVQYVFSPVSAGNVEAYAELMTPRGIVVAVDEPEGLDTLPLKTKSQAWHWELMFTRPLSEPGSTVQREILDEVSRLVDAGELRTTETRRLQGLTAATLREAHRLIESGGTVGKIVVER